MALIGNALVVGGGIGGMCAAIRLAEAGIETDLLEITPDWAPDGAGLTISSPTLRALRQVGVIDAVLAHAGSWKAIDLFAADGTLMRTMPESCAKGAEDLPGAAGIMRPVLARILADATRAAGVRVFLGARVESMQQDADGVDVRCSDGSARRYDLVVGADGLKSGVRPLVAPACSPPAFTGQGSWRAVVPRTRENSAIYMGGHTKAGINPVSATESYLFVLDRREGMEFIDPAAWPRLLAELLGEFAGDIGAIREGLLSDAGGRYRVLYRPLASHLLPVPWHRGRIVLLGDAVHATTPHLASGAGIAIEGALILAEELSRRHSLEGALAAYAGRHYDRARLVISASVEMGRLEREGGSRDAHRELMLKTRAALCEPI